MTTSLRLARKLLLGMVLVASCCRSEEVKVPEAFASDVPLANDRLAALVTESAARTRIEAALLPPAPADAWEIFRDPAGWAALKKDGGKLPELPDPLVRLEIDWLEGFGPAEGFTLSLAGDGRQIVSRHQQERATIRRTILADREGGPVFIHAIADLPGTLGLRVRLLPPEPQKVETVDRRQLVSTGPGEVRAHVWVLPFESDVEHGDDNSIVIRGEGEALVILNFARSEAEEDWLAETLKRLGDSHDPGHWPPNPSRIWHGVLASQAVPPR